MAIQFEEIFNLNDGVKENHLFSENLAILESKMLFLLWEGLMA